MYADSEAAWNYLIKRNILPQDILIYGESLGGAVAINLAVNHPEANRLIVQSSFTSMAEVVKHRDWLWLFPIDLILTEKFDSISKIRSLKVPVLFMHGTGDSVVPSYMSERLFKAAPGHKQLLLVPGAEHYRIYQPGNNSYLRAIEKFIIDSPNKNVNPGGTRNLVQQAFSNLKNQLKNQQTTLKQLLQLAPTEQGIFANHLRQLLWSLQHNPSLKDAYKKVVMAKFPIPVDSEVGFKLQSLGLVKLSGNDCIPSCNLYKQYFSARLVES